jgi:hypothetical protein
MPASKRCPETDEVIFNVLRLGLDWKSAAQVAGVTERTVRNWRAEDEAFSLGCEKAKGEGKMRVAARLVNAINNGNVTAMIFWLKTRTLEFREQTIVDATDDEVRSLAHRLRAVGQQMSETVPAEEAA